MDPEDRSRSRGERNTAKASGDMKDSVLSVPPPGRHLSLWGCFRLIDVPFTFAQPQTVVNLGPWAGGEGHNKLMGGILST